MVGLVLVTFLTGDLLLREGVEPNPGPEGKENARTVQTRLTASGSRPPSGGTERRGSASQAPPEPTLADLMNKLINMDISMNDQFEQVRSDFQYMRAEVSSLQNEVQAFKEKVDALESENDSIKDTNKRLLERVSDLENHVDDLEGRSRRNNILVHGLDKEDGEDGESLELRLRELFTDKLELADDIQMDRVHRLGNKPKAPIIARLTFYKDKVTVMKAKHNLKGSDFFIGDDFSKGVREKRKLLSPYLKEMKEKGKKASLFYDHIIMDGKRYFLKPDGQSIVEKT